MIARHLALITALLADHQRADPHHEDRCPLCKEAKAVLESGPAAFPLCATKFQPGTRWRMRGGMVATIYPAVSSEYVVATWPDMSSVFTPDGCYWPSARESEFDLIEQITEGVPA